MTPTCYTLRGHAPSPEVTCTRVVYHTLVNGCVVKRSMTVSRVQQSLSLYRCGAPQCNTAFQMVCCATMCERPHATYATRSMQALSMKASTLCKLLRHLESHKLITCTLLVVWEAQPRPSSAGLLDADAAGRARWRRSSAVNAIPHTASSCTLQSSEFCSIFHPSRTGTLKAHHSIKWVSTST
jgi:hypothetical protein